MGHAIFTTTEFPASVTSGSFINSSKIKGLTNSKTSRVKLDSIMILSNSFVIQGTISRAKSQKSWSWEESISWQISRSTFFRIGEKRAKIENGTKIPGILNNVIVTKNKKLINYMITAHKI